MLDPLHVPTRDGYDLWASLYDSEDNPLIALEERHFARLLGEVGGLRVLDVGCGTGRHAIPIAAAGAEVLAMDFSEGMLARARTKPGGERVRFLQQDLGARLPEPDQSFDRVLCCLVLDHVADLPRLLAEMARLCRPEGFILISVMHPAMMLLGIQARFTDPQSGRVVWPASVPNRICDYVMAAGSAGCRIEQMEEHAVDEQLAVRSPRAAKYLGWSLLLLLRLRVR